MCVFWVVTQGIRQTMIETLQEEITHHVNFVAEQNTFKTYVDPKEWEEVEHTDLSLNPVFISIYDNQFRLVENSPNLVQNQLLWNTKQKEELPYLTQVDSFEMLISQSKLIHHGSVVGYVVVGVSTKHNALALNYLNQTLFVIFPIAVLLLFVLARAIASYTIRPVYNVIKTAQAISENNLSERISLPEHKDELYELSNTLNSLLDRLEYQIIKANQFSADASHELRTPLAVIKGTLSILIRRNRTQEEFVEKISYTLKQVDRLDILVEQFLLLARIESNSLLVKKTSFDVMAEVAQSLNRFDFLIQEKNIQIEQDQCTPFVINNYHEFFEVIIDNLLSNAIKYVPMGGKISISSQVSDQGYVLSIRDNGLGMNSTELHQAKQRFFRAPVSSNTEISGAGLGLHIAQKLALLSDIEFTICSAHKIGTEIQLHFQK